MHDLTVIYRMCGIVSTNPSPWSQKDKYYLNEICLKSFLSGFKDIKIKVHVLLDHCGKEYINLINKYLPNAVVENSNVGINDTMLRAYFIACKVNGYVLFQECDYLYRPNIGKKYLSALKKLDIVSPYDHRNFYLDKDTHSSVCEIELIDNYHYRSVERNTMTWATHSDVIKENKDILYKYGYLDDEVWFELLIAGRRLWAPIPSFATHCVTDYLAPGIDWGAIWQKHQ